MLRSQKVVEISTKFESIPLLVLSPNHGEVTYFWEKKGVGVWESLCAPSDTCILYTNSPGCYQCTVEEKVFEFEVKGELEFVYKNFIILL